MKYKKFIGEKPVGISQEFPYSLCVFDIENGIDDYVISAWYKGDGTYTGFRRTKARYQGERAFIERAGRRYYLDSIARVDSPWCNADTCKEII